MSLSSLFILSVFLLIHQSATSSVADSCTASLSSDFTKDCDDGKLRNFARCLRDTKSLNSMIVAYELNKQYCGSGNCEFLCSELNGPPISCSCTCSDTQDDQRIHKRAVIVCNDCFKLEVDEINIGM